MRERFGSRSSRSFITWLVLSVLFLRFFSSSRAWIDAERDEGDDDDDIETTVSDIKEEKEKRSMQDMEK